MRYRQMNSLLERVDPVFFWSFLAIAVTTKLLYFIVLWGRDYPLSIRRLGKIESQELDNPEVFLHSKETGQNTDPLSFQQISSEVAPWMDFSLRVREFPNILLPGPINFTSHGICGSFVGLPDLVRRPVRGCHCFDFLGVGRYHTAMANLIDGRAIAKKVRQEVQQDAARLRERGVVPHLVVILVGDDPASQIYVRNKARAAEKVGIRSTTHHLPADTSESALLEFIRDLNAEDDVHGILVQLPLPPHLDSERILEAIDPQKDVDGLHPENLGRLLAGHPRFLPCTPQGILRMLQEIGYNLEGKDAVVVGRSTIVGKPMALLLLQHHATVTMVHSRTRDLGAHTRRADVLVVAAGKAGLIRGEMVKEGAVVIDVGINRMPDGTLRGDVAFDEVAERAAWITPVPGGVGPMTVAMLLKNTVQAARLQAGS